MNRQNNGNATGAGDASTAALWAKTTAEGHLGNSVGDHGLHPDSGAERIEAEHFYAHSKLRADGSPAPLDEWEPLFTPLGDNPATECQGENCESCKNLKAQHGHLNKVAWWTAKFAAKMFAEGLDREAARQRGYIAGLGHVWGRFRRSIKAACTALGAIPPLALCRWLD